MMGYMIFELTNFTLDKIELCINFKKGFQPSGIEPNL